MRNLISKFRFERLRKILSGAAAEGGSKPAATEILEAQEAMALVEALCCDLVSHCPGDEGPEFRGETALSSTNAFGGQVLTSEAGSVPESIAAGEGVALSGMRSAVFLPGDHLAEGYSQLQSIATRHVPLLVHAAFREGFGLGSSHSGYFGASDLGLFQVMPQTIQQAIDLTLLARWVAERSLSPGLIGFDRRIVEKAALPTAEQIREFLGYPEDQFSSPSAAQLLLFGGSRRAVPGWFDLDRPVAFGSIQGSNDGASAAVGREAFFLSHLPSLIQEGMEKLSAVTERELKMVEADLMQDADLVIVGQGSVLESARAAARFLREDRGWKVGVLGLTWLRPFPSEKVRSLLSGKKGVAVLECSTPSLADEGPLMREVRRSLKGEDRMRWISGVYGLHGQPIGVGQLVEMVADLREARGRSKVWLGIISGPGKIGDFPKRESLVKSVASDYPELAGNTISNADVEKLESDQVRTIQWIGSSSEDASEIMSRLAEACLEAAGPKVRGFGWYPEPGVLSVRVSGAPDEAPVSESGTAVDVLLLGKHGLDLIHNPLADVKKLKYVLVESSRSGKEIWELMPDFWRSEVKRLKLKLYRVEEGLEQMLAAANALISGSVDLPYPEIEWTVLEEPKEDLGQLPELIRRVRETGANYDSLPRFWGEVMQPKRGGISDNFPDPLVTVGAVPPYTAVLARPRGTALPNIPVLDPGACTACGRCWPICPDSAIGASLLGIQEFLDAAAEQTDVSGKVAGAVKRAHRPLASKVASLVKEREDRSLTSDILTDAFDAVLEKMPVTGDDKDEHRDVFQKTVDVANRLSPVVTERFFDQPEASQKGSGQLLLLAFNPAACQGCQLCINSCPEDALSPFDRAGTVRDDAADAWGVWEKLPDTAGSTVAAAAGSLDWGEMPARFLSRHSSQVQAVGSFGEPGSGERLACRLVTGEVESRLQSRLSERAERVGSVAEKLREQVRSLLAEGLVEADPKTVEEALASLPRHRASLSDLSEKLSQLGKGVHVDPVKTLRLAETAHQLEDEAWRLGEGVHGLGRARFGLAIVSHRVARWAGRFPNHPYNAPLVVEPTPEGAGLVAGLAQASMLRHLSRVRWLRKGELYLESPPDLPGRLADLENLQWGDLTEEERQSCPPILVFADESSLTRQGLGALSRILTTRLPVKLVILDGRGAEADSVEPTLLGLACRDAFVLAASLSELSQLSEGLDRAIDFSGPALVQLHVPIPQEHGFAPGRTLERARLAVEARVQPLLRYDPETEGAFGVRLSLEGNPALDADWGESTFLEWAFGEKRFSRYFTEMNGDEEGEAYPAEEFIRLPVGERSGKLAVMEDAETGQRLRVATILTDLASRRLQIWQTLQEMAGITSPFVDRIREQVQEEVEAAQSEKFNSLKRDYESQLADVKREMDGRMAAQLRDRLLTLAGFGGERSEQERSNE